MKFKTDENMPVEVAEDLQQAGYNALTVADSHPGRDSGNAVMGIVGEHLVGLIAKQVVERTADELRG